MDIRGRPSKLSKGSNSKTQNTSSSTENKVDFGQSIGMSENPHTKHPKKRPRMSLSDERLENSSLHPIASSSSYQSNNTGLLNKVSNTVSGLFSNVSWTEWLIKSPSISVKNGEPRRNENSNIASELSSYPDANIDNQSCNQLYPEEGIAKFNLDDARVINAQGNLNDKSAVPQTFNLPSFKRDMSFVSSTLALSPISGIKGNEGFLSENIISQPSTSDFQRELLPTNEDSLDLLKKTFPESHLDSYTLKSNGSSRKRLRESNDDEAAYDAVGQSINRTVKLLSPQSYSEETEAESFKRKRPRFSISTYGSPLYGKKIEEDEEPSFSIFYPGKIMYGGASNHQRNKRIMPRKICPRTPVATANSAEDHSDGGLSLAARRILNCIDKISTPLSESKRAFPFRSPRDFSVNSSTYVADFHKHRPSLKANTMINTPPSTKLLTPSKVKVNNLSMLLEPTTVDKSLHEENRGENRQQHPPVGAKPSLLTDKETFKEKLSSFAAAGNPSIEGSNTFQPSVTKCSFTEKLNPVASRDDNFKSKSISISSNSEIKSSDFKVIPQTTNTDEEKASSSKCIEIEAKSASQSVNTTNNMKYSFSEPGIISELLVIDALPESKVEFKFSHPINEVEISTTNDCKSDGVGFDWGTSFKAPKDVWECGTCLLQNEKSKSKCVACETPKQDSSSGNITKPVIPVSNFSNSWGDAFKAPVGTWECESCLIQNKKEDEKCVACLTLKPKKESEKQQQNSSVKSVSETFTSSGWGDSFKPAQGSWECSMCLLSNKASTSVCAACETKKPADVSDKSKPIGVKNSINSWGDAFKSSEGSWDCAECLVQNTANSTTCVACTSQKPKIPSEETEENKIKTFKENFNLSYAKTAKAYLHNESQQEKVNLDSLKGSEDNWTCSECLVTNKNSELKCVRCKCSNPSIINDSPRSSRNSSFGGGFGAEFLKAKDEWECETCLVRNKSTVQKCVSCATLKIQPNRSTIVSEAMTGNFKFGVNSKPANDISSTPFSKFSSPEAKEFLSSPLQTTTVFKSSPIDSSKLIFGNSMSLPPSSSSSLPPPPPYNSTNKTTPLFSFFKSSSETPEMKTADKTELPSGESKPNPLFQFSSVSTVPEKQEMKGEKSALASSEIKPAPPPVFKFGSALSVVPEKQETKSEPSLLAPSMPSNPVFQFSLTTPTQNTEKKLEFPKIDRSSLSTIKNASDPLSQKLATGNPATFSFFDGKTSSAPLFKPPNTNTVTSTNTSISSNTFAFGQPNSKPITTGFNFGDASSKKESTFNFGTASTAPPLFQFGQNNTFNPPQNKILEPAAPAFLNIEAPKTNPFNATASSGIQQRRTKKAVRRNK